MRLSAWFLTPVPSGLAWERCLGWPFVWLDRHDVHVHGRISAAELWKLSDGHWRVVSQGARRGIAWDIREPTCLWLRLGRSVAQAHAVAFLLNVGLGLGATLAFYLVARSVYDPAPTSLCRCGYDLTGNISGKCPECGTTLAGVAEKRQ